jgi:hypothetical protein
VLPDERFFSFMGIGIMRLNPTDLYRCHFKCYFKTCFNFGLDTISGFKQNQIQICKFIGYKIYSTNRSVGIKSDSNPFTNGRKTH